MPYLSSIQIKAERKHPFPFDIPAVKFAKDIQFPTPVTFIIGDNGTGKSTLLETLAFRLQLPHIDGSGYGKRGFEAAKSLLPFLELCWGIERSTGFFFRAEDFGDYLNSVEREDIRLHQQLYDLEGEVPDHIISAMKESANYQLHHVRKHYGQELQAFSHGEAYLQIMQQKINQKGIYLLDEPEAALSPSKQLSLLYFIHEHLESHVSQFIIVTHAPILMIYPGATIYEVTTEAMHKVPLKETEHHSLTKSILNNPEAYLRFLR